MAGRLIKLIKAARAEGVVVVTGGLAHDAGLLAAMTELAGEQGVDVDLRAHPDSIHAGAIGAAIWGAFRARKLAGRRQ